MRVNGRTLNKGDFGKIAAFVQQDDVLKETCTTRGLFEFSCIIRLGLKGKEMKKFGEVWKIAWRIDRQRKSCLKLTG